MRAHLGGSSRQSLEIARTKLDAAVKGANAPAVSDLSSELFFAVGVLTSNVTLRRAITDPAREGAAKQALIKDLFGSKFSALSISLLGDMTQLRWSSTSDLINALEQIAIEAQASAANLENQLDVVEDEFFATAQAVADSYELRKAFIGTAPAEAKSALIKELLSKNASESTVKLTTALVSNLRGRSIESAFADFMWALAARRNRVIALVRVAADITPQQRERLSAALTKQVGQPVRVNVEIDPTVLGGVSVKFADEIVDGSISNRLASAGRALVGNK
ncbi:AtpH F0F1-type ATP synthase, delta subunit (mitochondrial oligomycin sensitivity protein) [Candidatus Nanopelagicaceae bacterium]